MRKPVGRWEWVAIGAITLLAAVLRLAALGKVSPDPFYDAAVRSMSLSLHNFFLGAFEPGGSLSIDKPPIDLWLQVASVKVLGFSSTTLKLPEALAGTAAVPLLFATVRRLWSPLAGLVAAAAMAALPVDVITARSDTMDGVMMMLIILAFLFAALAVETGSSWWLLGAAAVLGVSFNVKLLESLIALPGIAVFTYLGMADTARRRLLRLALAGAVYVAVSLSWLTATLLVPASERPWAIGSTNGSAWNAAFVFNGTQRLGGKSPEPQFTVYQPGHHYPEATQSERDHIPIVPPSPTRLLARIGPLSGERLGLELLVALLLGVPALAATVLADRRAARDTRAGPVGDAAVAVRLRRATAGGLAVWMLVGIVLFSDMARLHPRYVESFTPAVAAMLGIGLAWAAEPRGRLRLGTLVVGLLATVYYGERLLYGTGEPWWISLVAAFGALTFALVARLSGPPSAVRRMLAPVGVSVLAVVAVLAVPFDADLTSIENHVTDAGYVGALPREEQRLVSAYLRAHQGDAYYQVAAESATQIGSLIVQDARPILALTSYGARVFTPVHELERLIAAGKVRYALLNSFCTHHGAALNPACSAPAKWVRAHGTDVSHEAGLSRGKLLWRLPGVRP